MGKNWSPEARAAAAERLRQQSADPDFARRRAEGLRQRNADPDFARANAERMRRRHADPDFAKANAERMRQQRADPDFAKTLADPAVQAKRAAAMRASRAARLGLRLDQMDAYRAARKLGCTIEEAVRDARRQQP